MVESLFRGDARQGFPGCIAEGASGRGQDQFRDLFAVARAETLVRAIVFAIHRKQLRPVFPNRFHYQLSAGNENFLIRQTDALAPPDGFVGRLQARNPDNRRNHGIDFDRRRHPNARSIPIRQFGPFRSRQTGCPEPV